MKMFKKISWPFSNAQKKIMPPLKREKKFVPPSILIQRPWWLTLMTNNDLSCNLRFELILTGRYYFNILSHMTVSVPNFLIWRLFPCNKYPLARPFFLSFGGILRVRESLDKKFMYLHWRVYFRHIATLVEIYYNIVTFRNRLVAEHSFYACSFQVEDSWNSD